MANSNGLATGKGVDDPHDWMEVDFDLHLRGTLTVLVPMTRKGYVCRRCRSFAILDTDKWNRYYPEMFPCKENADAES